MIKDFDGDLIKVIYKSKEGGRITAKGRTLYVTGGGIKDRVIRILKVKGGHLGFDKAARWLDADHVRNIVVKPKAITGGNIINYSFQLTGEEKLGKSVSVRKMIANLIADTSGSNAFSRTVCGYDEEINPQDVTDWKELPVQYTIKKIKVIGGLTEGTFILKKEPLKKKITGDDNADWVIDGILQ